MTPTPPSNLIFIPQRLSAWLRGWPGELGALIAGALAPLAHAPISFYPLAVIAITLLCMVWQDVNPCRALWRGWLFGLGQFGVGSSWVFVSVNQYGNTGIWVAVTATALLVAYLALYPALLGYLSRRFFASGGWGLLFALPALWVLAEWWRGWFLSGFSWPDLGYSQIGGPLAGWAPVLGVYGISWLVVLSGAALAWLLLRPGYQTLVIAAVVALLWVNGHFLGRIRWAQPAGPELRASVIQGNIPQDLKWEPSYALSTLEIYRGLSESEWSSDVIVWPETAVPLFYDQVADGFIADLHQRATEAGSALVFGIPLAQDKPFRFYNGIAVAGNGSGFYRKRHLVPFGEYFPLREPMRWLNVMDVPMSDFTPGSDEQPLMRVGDYAVGLSICYEITLSAQIARDLPAAAFLVTISNDAWFGKSFAPHQHLEIARMRAKETARYLLRATNTGISAIVNSGGELLGVTPQFKEAVLNGKIMPLTGATPYVRWGNGLVLGLMLVLLGVAATVSRFWSRA